MAEEKKKGLFGKAIDALTSRDEKAAAEKAEQSAQTAQNLAAAAQARAQEAEKKIAETEAKAKQLAEELKVKENQEKAHKLMEEMRARDAQTAAAAAAAAPKFIAEYEVKGWDETLSHVALKYYGNATRPYWEVIYEANKAVVGDNPNIIKPGMVLKIPELPADLKK